MLKKRFNNDKKEHFWHKSSLKAIIHSYINIILQHFVVVIKLLFIKLLE